MLSASTLEFIAKEIGVEATQASKAIEFFGGGATIPFVARYRKDAMGKLGEKKLEEIARLSQYFTSLDQRRNAMLETIEKQGKLTPELREAFNVCIDKYQLEDLYLPFKKKRRTKASLAQERGLKPLADYLADKESTEEGLAEQIQACVKDADGLRSPEEVLEGARHILAERISLNATARQRVRDEMISKGRIASFSTKNSEGKKTKYESYYKFEDLISRIPSHRLLAILRGSREGLLRTELLIDDEAIRKELTERFLDGAAPALADQLNQAVSDAYNRLMRPSIENEVVSLARRRADEHAIVVFRENAQSLLLAPPAGKIRVLAVHPGLKGGCHVSVIDEKGDLIKTQEIAPDENPEEAKKILCDLIETHSVQAVVAGSGNISRESSKFARELLAEHKNPKVFFAVVNEAGVSAYSASKVARDEFHHMDANCHGATSIARRLQDPLTELVKIEPRSVGVGQYQHDVNQKSLREGLHNTVVSCVNKVGVDVNTASVSLLRYVSGVQYGTAQNIVTYRAEHGVIKSRQELLDIDGIGPRVFEQCAGFLRVVGQENALDATGIHPESYPVVEKIAASVGTTPAELLRNREAWDRVDWSSFESDTVGPLALSDIRAELLHPGRDPRGRFRVPQFLEGLKDINDVKEGVVVEGMVTNVTDFGAFVDIGIHQDGLVHLSEMANRYVHDPRQIVHPGQIVKVKVIAVDKQTPRISLSMKAVAVRGRKMNPRRRNAAGSVDTQTPAHRTDRHSERAGSTAVNHSRRAQADRRPKKTDSRSSKPHKAPARRGHKDVEKEQMNTQLADQLASLRDKLDS